MKLLLIDLEIRVGSLSCIDHEWKSYSYMIFFIKRIRALATFWISEFSIKHLQLIRAYEIQFALRFIPADVKNIVEIGGGVGWQVKELKKHGFQVRSFDVESSNYAEKKNDLVELYDGKNLPIRDGSMDLVFSSNVLEHIADTRSTMLEQMRVLRQGGYCLHILPSTSWRFWTSFTDILKKWYLTPPHGELSDTLIGELLDFRRSAWKKRFTDSGFEVIKVVPGGIFCTGNAVFSERLGVKERKLLSRFFGSSCNYFVLKKL